MAITRLEISQGNLSMKKLFYLLLLPALSAGSAFSQQLNLLETVIQSPGGWRLIGVNREALVFWIQPSEAKGDATDRAVPKVSVAPDRDPVVGWVHINCPKALMWQSEAVSPHRKTPQLLINQGSTWETIGKVICPPGTYGAAALDRPVAPPR